MKRSHYVDFRRISVQYVNYHTNVVIYNRRELATNRRLVNDYYLNISSIIYLIRLCIGIKYIHQLKSVL